MQKNKKRTESVHTPYQKTVFFFCMFFLLFSGALSAQAAKTSCNVSGAIMHDVEMADCLYGLNGTPVLDTSPFAADPDPADPFGRSPIGNIDPDNPFAPTANEKDESLLGLDQSAGIATYIRTIYVFAIGLVGIIATVVIMIGGLIWISSLGNANRVNSAKEWIGAAISGLALAMFSYMILFLINPDLVKFKDIVPKIVEANSSGNKSVSDTQVKTGFESITAPTGFQKPNEYTPPDSTNPDPSTLTNLLDQIKEKPEAYGCCLVNTGCTYGRQSSCRGSFTEGALCVNGHCGSVPNR